MDLPEIRKHHPLGALTTTGLGGPARYFARAKDTRSLRALLAWARSSATPVFILGGGSNTVCADAGFGGLVIQLANSGISSTAAKNGREVHVAAEAGTPWDVFVEECVANDLAGLECLSGIPGNVGATPIQNVGAYGQEISQTLLGVDVVDRHDGAARHFLAAECELAYRHSRFKAQDRDRYVITRVHFRLQQGGAPQITYPDLERRLAGLERPTLRAVREAVLAARAEKSMLFSTDDPNHRSCGSFFLNPVLSEQEYTALSARTRNAPPRFAAPEGRVKVPAAWLIEAAGFTKGHRDGAVGLSTRHSLCLVCHDGASAAELTAFAERIQGRVRASFGVELTPEPVFLGLAPPGA